MTTKIDSEKAQSTPLTLKEAGELLGCHPNTLRQWDRSGVLKAIRFGPRKDRRYYKEDLEKFLERSGYVKNQQEAEQVSLVRQTYVEDYAALLVQWGKLSKASTIIDVPCGTGAMARALAEKGFGESFVLMDINAEMIRAAQECTADLPQKFAYTLGDAADIGTLVDQQADAIFCLNGFHIYIDKKEEFLKGCYQRLKPGGVLIFDVSTRGIGDTVSKDFLRVQSSHLEQSVAALGGINNFPPWPDESLMDSYRAMTMKHGFSVDQALSIDTWKPIDDVINETLKIPGRLRKWFPSLSEDQRVQFYQEACAAAKKTTGITTIKHNRVFFVATKK